MLTIFPHVCLRPSFAAALILLALTSLAGWPVAAAPAGKEKARGEEATAGDTRSTRAASSAAAAAGAKAGGQVQTEEAGRTLQVASFTVRGALAESAGQAGLLGQLEGSVRQLIARLDQAASDKEISAVLLRIENPVLGRGRVDELREAVRRARRAGKTVYAQISMAGLSDYLLASACDRIVMPESGVLLIPGQRAEVTYYKRLLDKLGIHADMLQVGSCKGAAEPLTRESMSPEFRQQLELLVDDLYEQAVSRIAGDRNLSQARVRKLIDTGLFTAGAARKAGLIDEIAYDDQLTAALKKNLGGEQLTIVKDYGKKKTDTNFSGMMGLVKLMEVLSGVDASAAGGRNKKIAVVYTVGAIMPGESETGLLGGQTAGSDTIIKALREAEADAAVVAIVLRVDSPGGSALASDLIWREIRRINKPVVASMGDVAASGGYYVAMGCDRVLAEPGTITGSIGVVGGKMAVGSLYDKMGVTTSVISRGKNSGLLSAGQPFSAAERKVWQSMLEETYGQFLSKAAEGRKMTVAQLEPLAEGRVWTGRQALAKGLIDQVGTLHDAVAAARELGGLDAETATDVMVLPQPRTFFQQLLEGPGAEAGMRAGLDAIAPQAARGLEELRTVGRLMQEPVLLWMPYRLEIH